MAGIFSLSRTLLAFMLAFACSPLWAQDDFPNRPIRMVVIYAAGSTSDVHARVVAAVLTKEIGQSVVVENNGGAGGLLAQRQVLRAQPLGYNLLYTTNSLVGNLYAFKDPQYKLEDYTVVGTTGLVPYAIMISSKVPGNTLQEFIAYAKANPGKLNYGSSGPSGGANILAERLKAAAGLDMVMIPFKGGDPATQAMMQGQIQVYFSTVGAVRTRIKTGLIKTLAMTGARRSDLLPDVPTFRELGYPSVTLNVWNAVFVPSAAPATSIQKLRDAFARAANHKEHVDYLQKGEYENWRGSLDEFMAYIRAEGEAIRDDYKRLKLPVQD